MRGWDDNMERIIKVKGKGCVTVKPDTTRIDMVLSGSDATYEAAGKLATAMTELLKVKLSGIGFLKDNIKTTYFDISPYYEDQIDENGEVHQIFQGYKYVHGMKLDFPNNADFLGKVITVLSSCPAKPEYKIRYTIADTEAVKNLIIGKAVADARKKAEVLTQAAGIRLGAIQTMEYTWDEIEFVSSTDVSISDTVEETITASARFNVEPENVEASDSVTVIWSIV